MSTHFFPPFHDFVEALMASLASRSHEWTYWEIIEKNQIDSSLFLSRGSNANSAGSPKESLPSSSFIVQTEIEIFLKNKRGAQIQRSARLSSVHSPSLFLDQVFDALFSAPSASSSRHEAFQSLKSLISAASEIPLKDEQLKKRVATLGSASATWIRAKNSQGQYLECVEAPKN